MEAVSTEFPTDHSIALDSVEALVIQVSARVWGIRVWGIRVLVVAESILVLVFDDLQQTHLGRCRVRVIKSKAVPIQATFAGGCLMMPRRIKPAVSDTLKQ